MSRESTFSPLSWLVVPYLLLGAIGALAFGWSANRFGPFLTIAAVVGIPFLVWLLISAVRHAACGSEEMRQSLTWWHGLWFLTLMSMLVFRVRGAGDIEQNPLDAWAVFRVVLEGIVALVLLLRLALRRTEWLASLFRGLPAALTVYGLICLASTAWSVFPAWTLYKSCEFLIDIALLGSILATVKTTEEYRSLLNWTWCLYGLLLVTVWVGVLAWPQEALYEKGFPVGMLGFRLRGVLPALSANDVGTFGGLLATIALARLLPVTGQPSGRPWYALLFAAGVATMVASQTRSAIAGFLFAVLLILLYSRRYAASAFMTFVLTPLIFLTSLGGLLWSFLQRGQSEAQLEMMSSRVSWWSFAWDKFAERPLTGFGAYAGGRFAVLAEQGLKKTSTMHSDYIEVIVGTGIWGLVPLLVAIIGAWWYLHRAVRIDSEDTMGTQMAYEGLAVLGLLTIRSVFMTMLTWHAPLHFLAVLGLAEVFRRNEVQSQEWERVPASSIRPSEYSPTSL